MEDFVDLGPGMFSDREEKVINWKGRNFYRACDHPVFRDASGQSHCVKPVGHASLGHEDMKGHVTIR